MHNNLANNFQMKKAHLIIILLISNFHLFSQSEKSLSFSTGVSVYEYKNIKSVIPFISTEFQLPVKEKIVFGAEVKFGNRNKVDNQYFNTYNFKDFELKLNYQNKLFSKLQLTVGCSAGVSLFYYSEIKKINTDITRDETLNLIPAISPLISIDYLFQNNTFVGLLYMHKITLYGDNYPNIGFSYGVKF